MFIYMAVIYWIIRRFGADAQAGLGIGQRLMQSMFLPVMAVAFATAPIVGQNFGAGRYARVRETFGLAVLIGTCIMVGLTLFCQWGAAWAVHAFTAQPGAAAVGTQVLQVISWNFAARGLVFTCSAVFQGLANTVPAVLSSASRIVSFVVPALWLPPHPRGYLVHPFVGLVASVTLQACISLWLVRAEFRRRLGSQARHAAVGVQG